MSLLVVLYCTYFVHFTAIFEKDYILLLYVYKYSETVEWNGDAFFFL